MIRRSVVVGGLARAGVIALLVNPNNPHSEGVIRDMQEAARAKGCNFVS